MVAKTPSILRSLHESIRKGQPADGAPSAGALEALAKAYAAEIDAAPDRAKALAELGPKLLATLQALGLTSTERGGVVPASGRLNTAAGAAGEPGQPAPADVLAALRARRGGR